MFDGNSMQAIPAQSPARAWLMGSINSRNQVSTAYHAIGNAIHLTHKPLPLSNGLLSARLSASSAFMTVALEVHIVGRRVKVPVLHPLVLRVAPHCLLAGHTCILYHAFIILVDQLPWPDLPFKDGGRECSWY